MIDCLAAGRLHGRAQSRTSRTGQPYVTCKVRVSTRDGEALFLNVIGFSGTVVQTLLALEDRDAVALCGELTATGYLDKAGEPRPSLELLAHQCLTEYHVQRKRQAVKRDNTNTAEPPRGDVPQDGDPDDLAAGWPA